jgi:hypothetical protein
MYLLFLHLPQRELLGTIRKFRTKYFGLKLMAF